MNRPRFEYDRRKCGENKAKHGIDFLEARALWDDENAVRIAARTVGESRFVMVGRIGEKHWSAVVTYRGERVRLISVRRSRAREVEVYEDE